MTRPRICFALALLAFAVAVAAFTGHTDLNGDAFEAGGLALLALGSLL